MEKIIKIEEGRSCNFKASAFSPIAFNKLFPGRDFMKEIEALHDTQEESKSGGALPVEVYEMFVRIAYTFAWQGLAPSPAQTPEQKEFLEKYPDPWSWIDTFNTFSIYEILPEIVDLWYAGAKPTATAKKNSRKQSVK